MSRYPITIIQGAQYGSEAKGAIAALVTKTDEIDVAVRTGATNAGHTAYYNGRPVVLQQLPVGFVRPDTTLVLGAGALIDPEILDREVALLSEVTGSDIKARLLIDRRAGLHVRAHQERSKASGRHHAIGATGKGCSEALIDRIRNRGTEAALLFGDSPYARDYETCDTERYLNHRWDEGARILLEGTQGQLLDLYLGPYPYTTHKQTGPAQWMLEAGLSPSLPNRVISVVRTFPIRVAGNSGPLPMETTWPHLAHAINARRESFGHLGPIVADWAIREFESAVKNVAEEFLMPTYSNGLDQHLWTPLERKEYAVALSELNKKALSTLSDRVIGELRKLFEMTTVTKKLRRVANLSHHDLMDSCRQARPSALAITFMNYVFPEFWFERPNVLSDEMYTYIRDIEAATRVPVRFVSFGPADEHVIELFR